MAINNPILFIGQAVQGGTSSSVLFVDQTGRLGQDNSNLYWNDSANALGIGINNPTGKLDVYGGIAYFRNGSAGSANVGGEIRFSTASTSDTVGGAAIRSLNQFAGESNGQAAHLAFYTNQRTGSNTYTGITERMRLTDSGNLAIGTTSATSRCSVSTSTQYDGINLSNGTFTVASLIGFSTSNDEGGLQLLAAGTAKVSILANGNSYLTGGNVGIGTTNPLAKLSVGAGSLNDSNVPIQASSSGIGTAGFFGFNKNGAYGLLVGYDQGTVVTGGCIRQVNTDGLYFIVNSTTVAQTIVSDGKIGINTSSPSGSAQLQIDSTSRGFLMPRMNGTQRTSISSPATGLFVYDTENMCPMFWNSTLWSRVNTNVKAIASIGSAQSGTTITAGTMQFRYSDNITGGTLQARSTNSNSRNTWALGHRSNSSGFIATTSISDTFTGSNGTPVTSRNSDSGHRWSASSNNFNINGSNQAVSTTNNANNVVLMELASTTYSVSVNIVTPGTPAYSFLLFRYQDANNWYGWGFVPGNGALLLFQALAGTVTLEAFGGSPITAGSTVNVRVDVNPGTFEVYRDGSLVTLTPTGTLNRTRFPNATKVGLWANVATGSSQPHGVFDSFASTVAAVLNGQITANASSGDWVNYPCGPMDGTSAANYTIYDESTSEVFKVHLRNEVDTLVFISAEAF